MNIDEIQQDCKHKFTITHIIDDGPKGTTEFDFYTCNHCSFSYEVYKSETSPPPYKLLTDGDK